jgi:formiminotetrahydrofolate cyclodeaminase
MSFLNKVGLLIQGAANDAIDKPLTETTIGYRENIRVLEAAMASMEHNAVLAAAQLPGIERDIKEAQTAIESKTAWIQRILAGPTPDGARSLGAEVVALKSHLADLQASLTAQQEASRNMDEALNTVKRTHTERLLKLREMERLERDTKSKAQIVSATPPPDMLNGLDSSAIEHKLRAKNDEANEAFNRSVGAYRQPESAETASAVDDLLASLKPTAPEPVTK